MSHLGVKLFIGGGKQQKKANYKWGENWDSSSLDGVLLAPVAVEEDFSFFIWREHIPPLSSPV